VRVILLEGGPRILPAFPESLSRRAQRDLERLGIEVRTNAIVTDIDEHGVSIGKEHIESESVFWAAGNQASPLIATLETMMDRMGRAQVTPELHLPDDSRVFVIGDAAAATSTDGREVPAVAPAATQMARRAAENIIAQIEGRTMRPFRYLNKGDLAVIGRHKAVASFFDGKLRIAGHLAWFTWLLVHVMFLVGFRNRLSVLMQWAYNYLFFERGVRLITETEDASMSRHPARSGDTGEYETPRTA